MFIHLLSSLLLLVFITAVVSLRRIVLKTIHALIKLVKNELLGLEDLLSRYISCKEGCLCYRWENFSISCAWNVHFHMFSNLQSLVCKQFFTSFILFLFMRIAIQKHLKGMFLLELNSYRKVKYISITGFVWFCF